MNEFSSGSAERFFISTSIQAHCLQAAKLKKLIGLKEEDDAKEHQRFSGLPLSLPLFDENGRYFPGKSLIT